MRVNWKAGGPKDGPGSLPAGSGPLPGSFPGPDTAGGSKVPTLRLRRGYFVCHVGVDEKLVGEEKKPEELRSRAWPSQGFYGSITSFHT